MAMGTMATSSTMASTTMTWLVLRVRLGLGLARDTGRIRVRVRVRVRVSRNDLRAVLPEAEHDADRGDAPMTKPRQGGLSRVASAAPEGGT